MKHETFKEWMADQFERGELKDIINYGLVNGFAGLTTYTQTNDLYDTYKDEIWQMLWDDKEDLGSTHILELIASFNGAKDVGGDEQFKNLLVWYAAERLASRMVDEMEDEDDEGED